MATPSMVRIGLRASMRVASPGEGTSPGRPVGTWRTVSFRSETGAGPTGIIAPGGAENPSIVLWGSVAGAGACGDDDANWIIVFFTSLLRSLLAGRRELGGGAAEASAAEGAADVAGGKLLASGADLPQLPQNFAESGSNWPQCAQRDGTIFAQHTQ